MKLCKHCEQNITEQEIKQYLNLIENKIVIIANGDISIDDEHDLNNDIKRYKSYIISMFSKSKQGAYKEVFETLEKEMWYDSEWDLNLLDQHDIVRLKKKFGIVGEQ